MEKRLVGRATVGVNLLNSFLSFLFRVVPGMVRHVLLELGERMILNVDPLFTSLFTTSS